MSRDSMENNVYDKIKTAIVAKKVRPGAQLIEATLSNNLNVSRTPIRNAFKRLEKEGYVKIIPNRGAFIIEPSKQEIIDAFVVRKELECFALKCGMEKISNDDFNQLDDLIKKEIEALKQNNIVLYLEVNKTFHLFMAKVSKNQFLLEYLERIINQINVYLLLYDTYYNASIESISSIKEHKQMAHYIKNHQLDDLIPYLEDHLDESMKDIRLDDIIPKSIDYI